MSFAPRFLFGDVRIIRRNGKIPKLPASLFNAMNAFLTRVGGSKRSRAALGARYDSAHAAALRVLETIADDEWRKGAEYPDWDPMLSGHVTLERLFRYVIAHFQVHAQQVRQGLQGGSPAR